MKFVQARALADARFQSLDLPYPGAFLDPAREFFPVRPPFVIRTGDETQAIFSPASAVLQAAPAAAAGIRGLIIVSWCPSRHSARLVGDGTAGQKTAVVLAVGIGSPLWLYAVLGWEHAPAVALSTASFAVALTSRQATGAVVAGTLMGAAALLRDEALLLIPGLLLVTWLMPFSAARGHRRRSRGRRPAGGSRHDVTWFERPPAAHLPCCGFARGGDAVGTARRR